MICRGFASCRCGSQIEDCAAGDHSVFTIFKSSLRRRAIETAVRAENHSGDRILVACRSEFITAETAGRFC